MSKELLLPVLPMHCMLQHLLCDFAGSWTPYAGNPIPGSPAAADAAYVHAVIHRQEGSCIGEFGSGFSNASYWYRAAGDHPIFPQLLQEGQRVAKGKPKCEAHMTKHGSTWQPHRFVALCSEVASSKDPELLSFCPQRKQSRSTSLPPMLPHQTASLRALLRQSSSDFWYDIERSGLEVVGREAFPGAQPAPPPIAPGDPFQLLQVLQQMPPPRRRLVIFKAGGYIYSEMEALIENSGLSHVMRMTNLVRKCHCILAKSKWDTGRNVNLKQHKAAARNMQVPFLLIGRLDVLELLQLVRPLLVKKGIVADAVGVGVNGSK
eukprot:gene1172-1510_t